MNHESLPSTFSASLFDEVHTLASALLHDGLTDQQAVRLEQLVVENPPARRLLASYLLTSASLHEWAAIDGAQQSEPSSSTASGTNPLSATTLPRAITLEDIGKSMRDGEGIANDSCPHDLLHKTSRQELTIRAKNILAMLDEEAEVAQRKAEEQARIERIAAEKFLASRQHRDRKPSPESSVVSRNAFYATVAVVAILFIFWMLPDPVPVVPTPVFVASINDSVDAQWSDPSLSTAPGTQLFTLGNLVLTRGVVEITFNGGAKTIVEAPATLELLSADSARLVRGRLVGRVPSSDVQLTIKTPQATIVDLGTEFGVSVDQQQVTHLHVFEGRVSAAMLDAKGKIAQQQTVLVDETVYLRPETGVIEPAPAAVASRFVRHVPIPLPRFSTGVDLTVGDADPNWRIVAAENDPDFAPQQAVVVTPKPGSAPNDPRQSQWVSLASPLAELPRDAQYTFRMTWTLADVRPRRLRGSFHADNLVTAIRVNGTSVSVPEHAIDTYATEATPFVIAGSLFKAGQNIIEFDVRNAGKRDGHDRDSSLLMRVQWKGGS